jgi:hypothetical protein
MAKEVKQGLDVIMKYKSGARPTTSTSSDSTLAFREDISFNLDLAARKVFASQGEFSHFKRGRAEGTLSISGKYVDETELFHFNKQISGQSVPFGFLELQLLTTDEVTIESGIQFEKIALDTKGKDFPVEDDASVSIDFQFGSVPEPVVAASILLS